MANSFTLTISPGITPAIFQTALSAVTTSIDTLSADLTLYAPLSTINRILSGDIPAGNAQLLDGLNSTAFSLSGHTHSEFSALSAAIVPAIDQITPEAAPAFRDALEIAGNMTLIFGSGGTILASRYNNLAGQDFYMNQDVTKVFGGAIATDISCFEMCLNLTEVDLPYVKILGGATFRTTGLSEVNLPQVVQVGNNCFADCVSLTSVSLPLATTLGDGALARCYNLNSVSLNLVTQIGQSAFASCESLQYIILPSATTLVHHAFIFCDALVQALLPVATSLEVGLFQGATSLTDIFVNTPRSSVNSTAFTSTTPGLIIHLRPDPDTPAGWVEGSGQSIGGNTDVTVAFDWYNYPRDPNDI